MQRTKTMTRRQKLLGIAFSAAILAGFQPLHGEVGQSQPVSAPTATIQEADVRRWLTDLSSDAMEGRRVFTEGYGLAAAYVAAELQKIGATPIGDGGYFQAVPLRRYRVGRASTVTVEARPTRYRRSGTA